MNSKEEQSNSEKINETNSSSKKEQINSENINETDPSSKEEQIYSENTNEIEKNYNFGWSRYSEITNARFAMIGFIAIILIELFSKQSFLKWAGIL